VRSGDGWGCDKDPVRPDICLGTDPIHTPPALTDFIEQFFRTLGWTVYRDKPYKGTYVPLKSYGKDKRVASHSRVDREADLYLKENGKHLQRDGRETGLKIPLKSEIS
jgi:N-formylglutamate amidohydrolase